MYTPEASLSATASDASNCSSTTGDVISVCGLNADGTKTISITPQSWTSTLSLVAIDKAGNVSTGNTVDQSTNPDTYTYYPDGTLDRARLSRT